MDGVTRLADAAAVGLVVTAESHKLRSRGPRSADALVHRLIEHKTDVPTLLRLAATDTVDVDRTSPSTEQFKSSVNVNAVNTPAAILAELSRHGLDLLAEPAGRVYIAGPPEAVLATELAEAMEANWPALSRLATPEPPGSEEVEPARPPPDVRLAGTVAEPPRRLALSDLRPAGPRNEAVGAGSTPAAPTPQAKPGVRA
jgi:hypothetical protein